MKLAAEAANGTYATTALHIQRIAGARRRTRPACGPGRPPTERLRGLPANGIGLARVDRRLLDVLAEATPDRQRAVARWAADLLSAVTDLLIVPYGSTS
jgi:hypothetical protein